MTDDTSCSSFAILISPNLFERTDVHQTFRAQKAARLGHYWPNIVFIYRKLKFKPQISISARDPTDDGAQQNDCKQSSFASNRENWSCVEEEPLLAPAEGGGGGH